MPSSSCCFLAAILPSTSRRLLSPNFSPINPTPPALSSTIKMSSSFFGGSTAEASRLSTGVSSKKPLSLSSISASSAVLRNGQLFRNHLLTVWNLFMTLLLLLLLLLWPRRLLLLLMVLLVEFIVVSKLLGTERAKSKRWHEKSREA